MIAKPGKKTFLLLLFILPAVIFAGCATTRDDPLKYTKELVKKGHLSLYNNGAFKVPKTSISLIPPGPDTLELVAELAGVRARESFLLSLKRASESVYVVSEGTEFSYRLAKKIHEGQRRSADEIKRLSSKGGKLLISRSYRAGKDIAVKSWEFSRDTLSDMKRLRISTIEGAESLAGQISEKGAKHGKMLTDASLRAAKEISGGGLSRSRSALLYGKKSFIKGYAVVPSKMKERAKALGYSLKDANFAGNIKEEYERRGRLSKKAVDLIGETVESYGADVADSFARAGWELRSGCRTTGLSFSILKSLRWVLQGILWDATIEPAAKIAAGSIGYVGVNFLAFPSMVVVREGIATTELAVEVAWDTAKTGYDLVAPTAVAAVAGIYSLVDFTGSNLVAGATVATGSVLGYGEKGLSKVAGVTVKGGGYVAAGAQYIGVPLVAAGITVGGGTIGTAVGGTGAAAGGVVLVTGAAGSATTRVFGNILSGATLVGGTAVSVAAGAASGVYELSKAVVVPAGYELGSGIVLSYGTLSHLAAHSVLAVSDCAYMALSLEGPRWVIYAVKGNLGKGEDLPVGAVLDLEALQESGEEIYYLPVSDEKMKNVVDSIYENLPEIDKESD